MKRDKVTRFNGENYSAWKPKIIPYLRAKDLLDIVTCNEIPPPPHLESARHRWFQCEAEALVMLLDSLKDEIIVAVQDKHHACEVCEHLQREHESKNRGLLVLSRQEFNAPKYDDNTSMCEHASKPKTLANEIRAHGRIVDDEELALQLLQGPPSSWKTFKTMYEGPLVFETLGNSCISECMTQKKGNSTEEAKTPAIARPTRSKNESRHYWTSVSD